MKTLIVAAVGVSAALAAAPASALTFYDAAGSLFLEVESSANLETRVEFTISDGSDITEAGTGVGSATAELLVGETGVYAAIEGGTDAPGGSSQTDLFLDVTFIIQNVETAGPASDYFAAFSYDIVASAGATLLPGEVADASVAITGITNFPSTPGVLLSVVENDPLAFAADVLAFAEGALLPGESASYGLIFDLSGFAQTPGQPGGGGGGGGAEVPLPAAGAMLLLGVGALTVTRRRRRT